MSNWLTMQKELLRCIKVDTAGNEIAADVKRAIVESIKFNRRNTFGFNQATAQLATENGVQRYALPVDFMGLMSPVWWSQSITTEDSETPTFSGRRELVWRPMPWIEANLYRVPGTSEYLNLGDSRAYSIDQRDHTLILSPVPGSSDCRLDFVYHKDPGTPGYYWNTAVSPAAWAFTAPHLEDAIADTFTNEWFNEGYDLVLNRAAFILWSKVYGGSDESATMQENFLRLWGEEMARLRGETARYASGTEVRRIL